MTRQKTAMAEEAPGYRQHPRKSREYSSRTDLLCRLEKKKEGATNSNRKGGVREREPFRVDGGGVQAMVRPRGRDDRRAEGRNNNNNSNDDDHQSNISYTQQHIRNQIHTD